MSQSRPTREGAGVHLHRVFGNNEVPLFDPYLLLDDFRSDNPDHYLKGFPWHPHRGIETITYVLAGDVEHGDSLGNKGVIGPGDVQWMTAGSGIIHQEMPRGDSSRKMYGFQLWANLPARAKMTEPRYQEISSDKIPEVIQQGDCRIRVIAGTVDGQAGPVQDIVTEPQYLDVTVPPQTQFRHNIKKGHTLFIYVFEGAGYFDDQKSSLSENGTLILYEDGDYLEIESGNEGLRCLLIAGKPIGEPVAWYGPIVRNTEGEIKQAFAEYRDGTFIKHG